tara:strand:- start:751 stop:2688 length:1938 start_codon:yes stop_codon:yes gene_type:complete
MSDENKEKQILIQITDLNMPTIEQLFPDVQNKNFYYITKLGGPGDRFQIDPYDDEEEINENDQRVKKTLEEICAIFPKLNFCPKKGGVKSKKKNKTLKKKKKKRRTSQKGCGGTGSKPVVKQCADDAACTPEEQVRMFEGDKRHSDFIKIINLGISISGEIPKAESQVKPNSKTMFSKGPITKIKNQFLGFGVQLKTTQHLMGDQTDNENAEKGREKFGVNNDEYMILTSTSDTPTNEEKEKIEKENKKLVDDIMISKKQLDATQVILKEKGLKEILLDIFSKPNTIPLDEVNRIIDNYFISLKKALEDPLYDTLMKLKSGISTDAIQRARNLGMSIGNIQTFENIQNNHQDLILKYFGDNEYYKALFNVGEEEVASFDLTDQDIQRHKRGGRKNRKKSTKKKRKKKKKKKRRKRTMKKSRKKRGGMNERYKEVQEELNNVDNGIFLDENTQADYNIMIKHLDSLNTNWSNEEGSGILTYEESRNAMKLLNKEIQIIKLLTKHSIIAHEINSIKLRETNIKMMEEDNIEKKKYIVEDKNLENSLTEYLRLLRNMEEDILTRKTNLSNELRGADPKLIEAIRDRMKTEKLIQGITKFQATVRGYFDKKYTELAKIAKKSGEELPMEKSQLDAYEIFWKYPKAPTNS